MRDFPTRTNRRIVAAAVAHDPLNPTIIERVKAEKREAEAHAKGQAKVGRHEGMYDYVQFLRCLLFWLMGRVKPRNCECFQLFRHRSDGISCEPRWVFDPGTPAAFDAGGEKTEGVKPERSSCIVPPGAPR